MEPKRIWWARPRKLCALERPGGGGRSHRPERRAAEIEYLNTIHLPVEQNETGLLEAAEVVRRETRKKGAVAIHDNRYTDFVANVCAYHLFDQRGTPIEESLEAAAEAGLAV
jgi:hypothetical protein